jgi:chromosome segregation ATPase
MMSEMEVTHQKEKEADARKARDQMGRQAGLIDAMQGRLGRIVGENEDLRKSMGRLQEEIEAALARADGAVGQLAEARERERVLLASSETIATQYQNVQQRCSDLERKASEFEQQAKRLQEERDGRASASEQMAENYQMNIEDLSIRLETALVRLEKAGDLHAGELKHVVDDYETRLQEQAVSLRSEMDKSTDEHLSSMDLLKHEHRNALETLKAEAEEAQTKAQLERSGLESVITQLKDKTARALEAEKK